jgi:ribosome-associated protein
MDIRKLQRTIVDALEAVKAQDIAVFNTEELTDLFDRVIVASGTSNRQTRALASSVRDSVKAAGFEVRNPEGEEAGEWVLVDCGAAVVHIMQPAIRAYYRLEELWGAKPVRLRRSTKKTAAPAAAGLTTPGPDGPPRQPPEKEPTKPARKRAAASQASAKRGSRQPATVARAAPSAATRKQARAVAAAPAPARAAARKTPAKRAAAKKSSI